MIKQIKHHPIFFSDLKYPKTEGLMETFIDCVRTARKKQNDLFLKIRASYTFEDLNTRKVYRIFRMWADYDLHTDGTLQPQELYKIYFVSMEILISELKRNQKMKGITPVQDLEPLPMESVEKNIQKIIDKFFPAPK